MSTAAVLTSTVLTLAFGGILFSGAAVFIHRRFGPRVVWIAWGAVVTIITFFRTIAFQQSFPDSGANVAATIYTMAMFIGIPTSVVAIAAIQTGKREPRPSPVRQFALVLLLYLASLPVALVIGALPDIARMF